MVRITEELVRKKSEHNELLISTLEEIALHQEDIEKIEHIQNWCRDLKILLLQSNLIAKIENLQKLKKLEYLNLAVNVIEKIENLEELESLNKLDLTLNFIGELTSINTLKNNYNLRILYLTGNPCTDFPNYRNYVITILPQLESLDGVEVKISDRIRAKAIFEKIQNEIIQSEIEYKINRDEQKIRVQEQKEELRKKSENLNEEERLKLFWETKSENCPETRFDIAEQHRKCKKVDCRKKNEEKKKIQFFAPCGRPYNMNHAKLQFRFTDEDDRYELNLEVYKFLDTSLIEVDVQPNYLRVTVKGKVFQLALNNEVKTTEVICQRSEITGHLLIIMPKLNYNTEIVKNRVNNPVIRSRQEKREPKGAVNYKEIIKDGCTVNLDEIPPLV